MKKTPFALLKEKEKKARRELIVDAAERLFSVKPFPKVSMRDIADESGISLSSIYRYFPDQESIFIEAFMRGASTIRNRIHKLSHEEDVTLEDVAREFVDYLIENDSYFRMMTHFMLDGVLNRASVIRLNEIERDFLDLFEGLFEKLHPEGRHRMTAHAFFAALNGVLITYRNYPGRDVKDVHKHMEHLSSVISLIFTTAAPDNIFNKKIDQLSKDG